MFGLPQSKVVSVWRRSSEAEGNPLHVPFTRLPCTEPGAITLLTDGLVDSVDWHRDKKVSGEGAGKFPGDRALLIQTSEHLRALQEQFIMLDSFSPSNFGENLFVEGEFTCSALCVGDVIEVVRGDDCEVVAVVQITSPRYPCNRIDLRHSQPLGGILQEEKVRSFCAETGFGGFFCKVLKEGSVAAGDTLVVSSRPCPDWTLSRISQLFYGGNNRKKCTLDEFQGTDEELQQVLNIKELAVFEWRENLEKYIQKKSTKEK